MKTIKILLGIIAINLTLLTIIQTGVWPPKVHANETNHTNVNYGLVPLNEDGSIDVKLSEEIVEAIKPPVVQSVNIEQIRGLTAFAEKQSFGNGERAALGVVTFK